MNHSIKAVAMATVALIAASSGVRAANIDAIYAFGDSLSDAGNVYALTGTPGPPYVNGEYSNGPVWVQDLAKDLGLPAVTASLLGGTDYAYGSGETGNASFDTSNPVTDLLGPSGQLAQFEMSHATADPNALYTIWIGSNDLSDIPANATQAQVNADVGTIVTNIDTAIGALAGLGAKNFLIVTVPDLGKTPLAIAGGPLVQAEATALSSGFDAALTASLAGQGGGLNLQVLNAFSLVDQVVSNPGGYGLTDVTDSCIGATTVCTNPNQYLFWDGMHPTAAGQTIVADAALALVTPEPSSMWLSSLGLAGLCLCFRRYASRDRIRYSRQPDRV